MTDDFQKRARKAAEDRAADQLNAEGEKRHGGYYGPHAGNPGHHGGSKPRGSGGKVEPKPEYSAVDERTTFANPPAPWAGSDDGVTIEAAQGSTRVRIVDTNPAGYGGGSGNGRYRVVADTDAGSSEAHFDRLQDAMIIGRDALLGTPLPPPPRMMTLAELSSGPNPPRPPRKRRPVYRA